MDPKCEFELFKNTIWNLEKKRKCGAKCAVWQWMGPKLASYLLSLTDRSRTWQVTKWAIVRNYRLSDLIPVHRFCKVSLSGSYKYTTSICQIHNDTDTNTDLFVEHLTSFKNHKHLLNGNLLWFDPSTSDIVLFLTFWIWCPRKIETSAKFVCLPIKPGYLGNTLTHTHSLIHTPTHTHTHTPTHTHAHTDGKRT